MCPSFLLTTIMLQQPTSFLLWPRSATRLLYDGVIKMDLLTCLLDINSPLRACVCVCACGRPRLKR